MISFSSGDSMIMFMRRYSRELKFEGDVSDFEEE